MIRQCNRTVGCNRTPVIGLLKQPIILSPLSLIHTKFISYLTPRWTITTYFITFHFVSLSIGTVTNRSVAQVWTDLNWVQLDWMWIQNEHGHKRPNTAPIRIHFERIIGPVREWSVLKAAWPVQGMDYYPLPGRHCHIVNLTVPLCGPQRKQMKLPGL